VALADRSRFLFRRQVLCVDGGPRATTTSNQRKKGEKI
jgi:hypothetical protein